MKVYKFESYQKDGIPYLQKDIVCDSAISGTSPLEISDFLNDYFRLGYRTEEYVYMVCMNSANKILGVFEIAHGTVNKAYCSAREVYQKALMCGSVSIVVAHNHPSNNLEPSEPDIDLYKRLRKAGELIGISLLDFLIVTPYGHTSFLSENIC